MTDTKCSELRIEIKKIGEAVLTLKDIYSEESTPNNFNSEVIPNVMLAYRHLEDAAMRLGKVIQHYEGGKGIYDDNDAKRATENGPVGQDGLLNINE